MASVQEPGTVRVYQVKPNGLKYKLLEDRTDGPISAGYSPDGVLANKTVDKQMFAPIGGPVIYGGDKIMLEFTFDGTDGLDVTDGVTQIPITFRDGTRKVINNTDLGNTTDLPAASIGTVNLGAGYTIPNGVEAKFGGGPIVISVEDDTA